MTERHGLLQPERCAESDCDLTWLYQRAVGKLCRSKIVSFNLDKCDVVETVALIGDDSPVLLAAVIEIYANRARALHYVRVRHDVSILAVHHTGPFTSIGSNQHNGGGDLLDKLHPSLVKRKQCFCCAAT